MASFQNYQAGSVIGLGTYKFKHYGNEFTNIVLNLHSLSGSENGVGTITVGAEGYLINGYGNLCNIYPYVITYDEPTFEALDPKVGGQCQNGGTIGSYSASNSWGQIMFNQPHYISTISYYEGGAFENGSSYASYRPDHFESFCSLLDSSGTITQTKTQSIPVAWYIRDGYYRHNTPNEKVLISYIINDTINGIRIGGTNYRKANSGPSFGGFEPYYLDIQGV